MAVRRRGAHGTWQLHLAVAGFAAAWIAFATSGLGDYPMDAGPAVDALAHGDVGGFLGTHPDMGPVSILLRAPLAAIAGAGEFAAYQWGSLACLLAAGVLGVYLASLARARGAGEVTQLVIAGVCVVNPLSVSALEAGHPEEVLTAALLVGAVAVAWQGHVGRTALLLGLAVACKQWALIGVLPVLMALPEHRLRAALGAGGIALALILPGILASPGEFFETQRSLAVETQYVTPWSAWYPGSAATTQAVPELGASVDVHHASDLVARISHPLILVVALAVPLGLALRRRLFSLTGAEAMGVLALLMLARCVLDPVDNLYYHEPFLLALLGWDALSTRGLPVRGLVAAGVLELLARWSEPPLDPAVFNTAYLAIAAAAAGAIVVSLLRPPRESAESEGIGGLATGMGPRLAASGGDFEHTSAN
jgi:hypothetical protein